MNLQDRFPSGDYEDDRRKLAVILATLHAATNSVAPHDYSECWHVEPQLIDDVSKFGGSPLVMIPYNRDEIEAWFTHPQNHEVFTIDPHAPLKWQPCEFIPRQKVAHYPKREKLADPSTTEKRLSFPDLTWSW